MSLSHDVFERYQQAGKIAKEVRAEMRHFVREGIPIIDVCERAEELIRQKGGQPAFPCNVSINEVAAHYTSPPADKGIIPQKSLVKVDIGAHVDGYIADTAVTVSFSREHENLIQAAEEALRVAVNMTYAGISTSRLGATIQRTIKTYGCKPVSNLTGHKVGRYMIHAGKSIPNVSHVLGSKIREGEVVAIEPFVTLANAAGKVKDGDQATIFRYVRRRSLNNPYAKRLLSRIETSFRTLPFSERWLIGIVPQENYHTAFHDLLRSKCIMPYYVFVEASGKPVAQAEHTVLVVKDGCKVLT